MRFDTKIILCLVLLFVAYMVYSMSGTAAHVTMSATKQQTSSGPLQTYSKPSGSGVSAMTSGTQFYVSRPPSLSAAFIDRVLCNAHSPACGTGTDLYRLGVQYGIDPAYALAFFQHESTYGRYGIASDNLGIGNIRCTSGYACRNGFRAYGSWVQGYEDWYKLIRYYVDSWHKQTVPEIIRTYAPSTENNTEGYIIAIENAVTSWRHEVA